LTDIVAQPRAQHIAGLTGLRFFAALAVVFFHTLPHWTLPGVNELWQFSRMGSTGVSLFFLLSGFILFHVYEQALKNRQFRTRDFLWARFARIYPVYCFGLALALPGFVTRVVESVHSGTGETQPLAAVAAPLLLQAWHPSVACDWNCPGWSLSAEAFFYPLFPAIGLFAVRQARRSVPFNLLMVYGMMLAAPLAYLAAGLPTDNAGTNPDLMALWFIPVFRLPEFIFGVLVARATLTSRWQIPRWETYLTMGLVLAVIYGSYHLPPKLIDTLAQNGLYAPLFALLVVAIAKSSPTVLGGASFQRLGEASYALYIIHMPIWGMFSFAARKGVIDDAEKKLPMYLCYIAVVLGGALIVHRYIELPYRDLIRRRVRERWNRKHRPLRANA
jgi:peptidoglycan/LPS O-acetylase OafA/YrhL